MFRNNDFVFFFGLLVLHIAGQSSRVAIRAECPPSPRKALAVTTRHSTPANAADYCYDPEPYELTQDDMAEWALWLEGRIAAEYDELLAAGALDGMTEEEREAQRQAEVLARWGSDEAPF